MKAAHLPSQVIACVAALVLSSSSSAAQDLSSTMGGCVSVAGPDTVARSTAARSTSPEGHSDLRIVASVSADEVTFAKEPKVCVSLRGDARLDSVRVVGRRNLASPVVRGTTYRNVYVAVEIVGHLDAACIASRITKTPADSTATCASLGVHAGAP